MPTSLYCKFCVDLTVPEFRSLKIADQLSILLCHKRYVAGGHPTENGLYKHVREVHNYGEQVQIVFDENGKLRECRGSAGLGEHGV